MEKQQTQPSLHQHGVPLQSIPLNTPSHLEGMKSDSEKESFSSKLTQATAAAHDGALQPLYQMKRFADLLKATENGEHPIHKSSQNTYYMNCQTLKLSSEDTEPLLLYVALAHFKCLVFESFSDNPHKQNQLFQLFDRLVKKQVRLQATKLYSQDQLESEVTQNLSRIIELKFNYNLSNQKITKNLVLTLSQNGKFLVGLAQLVKVIVFNYIDTCSGEILTSFINNQQLTEKEKKAKLTEQISAYAWKEIKPELMFLLAQALNRTIEIHSLKEVKLEKTIFQYKQKETQLSKYTSEEKTNLKINLFNIARIQQYYLLVHLTESDLFDCQGKMTRSQQFYLTETTNVPSIQKQAQAVMLTYQQQQLLQQHQQQAKQQSKLDEKENMLRYSQNSSNGNSTASAAAIPVARAPRC